MPAWATSVCSVALLDPVVDDPLPVLELGVGDVGAVLGEFFLHPGLGAGDLHRRFFVELGVSYGVGLGSDLHAGDRARVVVHDESGDGLVGGLLREQNAPLVGARIVPGGGLHRRLCVILVQLRYEAGLLGRLRPIHLRSRCHRQDKAEQGQEQQKRQRRVFCQAPHTGSSLERPFSGGASEGSTSIIIQSITSSRSRKRSRLIASDSRSINSP